MILICFIQIPKFSYIHWSLPYQKFYFFFDTYEYQSIFIYSLIFFSSRVLQKCLISIISALRPKLLISLISSHCLISDAHKPPVKEMLSVKPAFVADNFFDGRAVCKMSVSSKAREKSAFFSETAVSPRVTPSTTIPTYIAGFGIVMQSV